MAVHNAWAGSDATSTLWTTLAIVVIVFLHWVFTSAQLCYLSVFKAKDLEVLKHYHDEYAPMKRSFKLKAESR